MTRCGILCSLFLLCVANVNTSSGIVIRHDRSDSSYIAFGTRFQMVGHLMNQVGCTLIDAQWAITAAHSVENVDPFSDTFVVFGDRRYEIEKIILHPSRIRDAVDASADLALLKLSKPVDKIQPASIYEKDNEVGKSIVLVGYGATGNGMDGILKPKGDTLRAATNEIEASLENSLITSFDAPPNCTELEGCGGAGDSGGPALLEQSGRIFIVGVASGGSGKLGLTFGKYGTFDTYARLSTRKIWIKDILNSDPPSTLTIWGSLIKCTQRDGLPATIAGTIATDFFNALKSGDSRHMIRFYEAHTKINHKRSFEERAHGWDEELVKYSNLHVYGYKVATDFRIAVVSTTSSNEWIGFLFELDPEANHKLLGISTGSINAPK